MHCRTMKEHYILGSVKRQQQKLFLHIDGIDIREKVMLSRNVMHFLFL